MKKIILLLWLFGITTITAQIGSDAPWMQTMNQQARVLNPNLSQISTAFNQYWENRDKDKKGSGYKPFKRWEQFWNSQLDERGYLMTREAIWHAWEQKQVMQESNARSTTVTSNWTSIGPYAHNESSSWSPGQGRVNFAIVDPNNSNTYYVGAPAGGIWKSTDSGSSWAPLSDDLPQIGVSGIAIDYNNSSVIYIATGDDDSLDTYSVGVMKSTDGGTTWNTTGLSFNSTFDNSNDIFINPNDSNMLWVATSQGIFKTTDAGTTWTNKLSGNVKDLKIKPNDYSTLYAVKDNLFYKSIDFGETFTQITTAGMPVSTSRMAIAVTPANANVVYFLNATSGNFDGVYKSTDSGDNFTKQAETTDIFEGSGQSYYDMAITVSNTNENLIFVGVLNIWKSTDGGDNFIKINNWSTPSGAAYTHADIHFLRYYDGIFFAGTDGGIYKSTDDGASFTDLTINGLAIGQFYRVSVSKNSSNNVVGGLQDNGGFGYSANTWYSYHGADGMDCAVDPTNDNTYYGFIQSGGGLYVSYDGGQTGAGLAGKPTGASGNWITPLVVNNQGVVYAGYDKLYKLDGSFVAVSGAVFGGNITNVEIDPQNSQTIFVSRGTSIFKSTDGGVTFVNVYSFALTISSIEVNNMDSAVVYVSTYGTNGKIHKSLDGGTTWTDITYNLPNDSKNVIRHQNHHTDNPLYVGTSLGVYYMDDTSANTWEVFDANLPNVSVTDLEINIYDHKITASTYGRGVWQSPIASQVAADDINLLQVLSPINIISCDDTVTPSIRLKNTGTNAITQIDISYSYDGAATQNYQWNGSLASTNTVDINLPTSGALAIGEHILTINSTIANDAYSDNNSGMTSFMVNDSAVANYLFTFEDTNTDTLLTNNTWEIATPASTNLSNVTSGTKAYCIAPNANYPHNVTAYLYSRCYDLTTITNPVLSFDMALRTELDWDYLLMEYSLDGLTWQILGEASDANWYNSATTVNALPGKQWTGIADTIQNYSYNLTAFTNETSIQFRFLFSSDGAVNEEGVVVDDFVINGTVLNIANNFEDSLFIHPNPSNGVFKISWNNAAIQSLEIYTISGQLIKTIASDVLVDNSYNLDLNNLAKGIYLLKIASDDKQITKKIILK